MTDSKAKINECCSKRLIERACMNIDIELLEQIKHWDFSKEDKFELFKMFCGKPAIFEKFLKKFLEILKPSKEEVTRMLLFNSKPYSLTAFERRILTSYKDMIEKEQPEEQVNETSKKSEEKSTEEKQTDKTSEVKDKPNQIMIDLMFVNICAYSNSLESMYKVFEIGQPSCIVQGLSLLSKRKLNAESLEKFLSIVFVSAKMTETEIVELLKYINGTVFHDNFLVKQIFIDSLIKNFNISN